MRRFFHPACALLSLALAGCSGVDIDPAPVDDFAAAGYTYYRWRSEPLPPQPRASDPVYLLDPVLRREVDASLAARGYVLDPARAQFSVDYLFAPGLVQGALPEQASNISPIPSATINRQVDQASVDNAIALGGLKETDNIRLQFNDVASNKQVWQVTLTKIVEDANQVDRDELRRTLKKYIGRALDSLPPAPPG